MFKIKGNRKTFYQWDINQQLIVDVDCTEVHFTNDDEKALVVEIQELDGIKYANVPNILLQEHKAITVYAYENSTKCQKTFRVIDRAKPEAYVYTETEVWTAEKAVEEALEEAKANGDFKGDKGDKGEAGVINFVVVSELPETGSGDSIYLLPNTTGEHNQFDEYIYHNEAWEKIGSAGVEVNLDEYVKKTDYASTDVAGVVKVNTTAKNGLVMANDGELCVYPCGLADIDAKKQNRKPITPYTIDYAVKSSMTTNALEWTDDEKQSARELIGAVGATDYASAASSGVVKVGGMNNSGMSITSTGLIYITQATNEVIDAKTNNKSPITSNNLDYAVKVGITANKETLTDVEKRAACNWLGATDNTPYDFDETYVIAEEDINKKGEYHRYTDSQGNPFTLSEMLVDFTIPPGANSGNAYLYFRHSSKDSDSTRDDAHMRISEFPYQHASKVRHTKNLCYKLRDGFYDIKCYGWTDGEDYTALQFNNGARMNCGYFIANPTPFTGLYFNVASGKPVVGTEIRVRGRRV